MAKSVPESTELSDSISIKTEKVASRWLGPFRGMTTPSHHKCAAVPPPIRAAGAGVGAFFTPTGYGTPLALNADGTPKETRFLDGKHQVLEFPIHGDVALIKAETGDRWGNLVYRKAARNFGPVMAMAAKRTIASVHQVVELGQLDPESIVTPGIFVSHIVQIDHKATLGGGFKPSV